MACSWAFARPSTKFRSSGITTLPAKIVSSRLRHASTLATLSSLKRNHIPTSTHVPNPALRTCPSKASWTYPFLLSSAYIQSRSMFIQTESTPNDDSLKFIPGVTVMSEGGTAEFLDTRSALASPLAIRLMGIEGVTGIFYGPDFVTVSKDSDASWPVIKPEIYSTLMEYFSSGQALFRSEEDKANAGPQDTRILDTDSETVAMIKELLDTRIRPAIMEDGGDIEYRGFDEEGDGLVRVKLKGSCRGCSSSTVTLKSGIERMMMHYIPEVKGVLQVMDEEEEIALDEFNKLEKKLASKEHNHGMAQYLSV